MDRIIAIFEDRIGFTKQMPIAYPPPPVIEFARIKPLNHYWGTDTDPAESPTVDIVRFYFDKLVKTHFGPYARYLEQ